MKRTPSPKQSKKLRVLFVASEMAPLAKTGGLADVVGTLPYALAQLGHDVRAILPKYRSVINAAPKQRRVLENITVNFSDTSLWCAVDRCYAVPGVTTYLIEHGALFDRDGLYGYGDDWLRFAFLCRSALETCKALKWKPHVIHCHDWQAGPIAPYLRSVYSSDDFFRSTGVLFTIHNLHYRGTFPSDVLWRVGLPWEMYHLGGLEYFGEVSFIKGGIAYADVLNTVSRTYAKEIQTLEFGEGLDGMLRERGARLFGVLNGIDYGTWNPKADPFLRSTFGPETLDAKVNNKRQLQAEMGLPQSDRTPVVGIVSRMTAQKGFDLIESISGWLLSRDIQLIVLGSGDEHYQDLFATLKARYPNRVGARLGMFSESLAHQIYGGADMFLMPSRFEPCGLGQMIAMVYGTIPIVHKTGGLVDTVSDFNQASEEGNGFVFEGYNGGALQNAILRALEAYSQIDVWNSLRKRAMKCDFTWKRSAGEYEQLYRACIKGK